MPATRRLAAILAADVAGYSRLIGADEQGTLERLRAIRAEVIDPKIAGHNGRLVKTTGDGLLAEFGSTVDSLRCATEIQTMMAERNAELVAEQRIDFRIGINVGDIVIEDGDIFGGGVNIAARLEGLADPGGICVSARVQEDAAGKLDLPFRDLGDQQLKNIARPIRAYAIDAVPVLPPRSTVTSVPRLSIVVLPFANLSNDPEQQYFADGITEDLTTDLSRIDGMLVISRNTAFTYRNKSIDTRQIGHELSVRYVLEGSVRRSSDQIRINAQLIDAEADTHLWSERFDHKVGDFFSLQDEITSRIAIALDIELIAAETARITENRGALDYYLRGRAAAAKPKTPANHAEAIAFYEEALALDPQSVQVRSWLASELAGRVLNQMTDTIVTDLTRAGELAEQALSVARRSWLAHFAKAQVLRAQGRFEEAIPEYETVIELNRNAAYAFSTLGQCKLFAGSLEEAITLQMQFVRLSPRDPLIGMAYFRIGVTHLLQSRTKEAIVWLERARNALPDHPSHHALLASAYALDDKIGAATAELAVARKLYRDGRLASIAHLKAAGFHAVPGYFGVPKVSALFEITYFAGLRKAGMPDE